MTKLTTSHAFILQQKHDFKDRNNLEYYYLEFFDATDFESQLLSTTEFYKTVIGKDCTSEKLPENITYHAGLIRRLLENGWMYLNENIENESEEHALSKDSEIPILRKEELYMQKLDYFKGKIIWLENDEMYNAKLFYGHVFQFKSFQEWIETLDSWIEYSFLENSICEIVQPLEVFETYIYFQKLLEIAYLIHTQEI